MADHSEHGRAWLFSLQTVLWFGPTLHSHLTKSTNVVSVGVEGCDKVLAAIKYSRQLNQGAPGTEGWEEKTLPPWDMPARSMSGRVQEKPLRSEQGLRASLKPVPRSRYNHHSYRDMNCGDFRPRVSKTYRLTPESHMQKKLS